MKIELKRKKSRKKYFCEEKRVVDLKASREVNESGWKRERHRRHRRPHRRRRVVVIVVEGLLLL